MAKTIKQKQLADAYQRARDLSNELHQAKQVTLPLRGEIVGLTNERDLLQSRLQKITALNESYRAALVGMVELVNILAGGKVL